MNILKTIWEKGAIHIFTGSFLTKLVSFFGSIVLVRVISKQDYGILGYLENIYGYVLFFAGMGMTNSILRYVVLGKDANEKNNYFSYIYKFAFVWNLILVSIVFFINIIYPHPEAYQEYIWMLNILLVTLPFYYLTDNALANERATFQNQRFAFFSFIISASIILGKVLFGVYFSIKGVLIGQCVVYIIFAVFLMHSTIERNYKNSVPQRLNKSDKIRVNNYAIQYMITNGLWSLFMLNDTFLLGRFSGPEVLAEYKVAYVIPGAVNLISSSIGIFVAPYFVKNENNIGWIRKNFRKVYAINAAFVGAICFLISVLANIVVSILYGNQYLSAVAVMRILLLAAFFNCGLRYTTANILAAMGKVKYNMICSIFGIAIQLGINIYMVPKYGATGVAITSCIVYLCMAIYLFLVFVVEYYKKN